MRRPTPTVEVDTGTRIHIPDQVHQLVELELDCAYNHGYQAALRDIAERADVLDTTWKPAVRRSYEQQVIDRVEAMRPAHHTPTRDLRADADRRAKAITEAGVAPDPCTRCNPTWPILCRCAGATTYATGSRAAADTRRAA